jgi:hypothetical protein
LRPLEDTAGIAACFDAYGVVGVTGVLTKTECDVTMKDMGMPAAFDIRDPSTYNTQEVRAALNNFGVIGTSVLWTAPVLRNRCHPNVRRAYQVWSRLRI